MQIYPQLTELQFTKVSTADLLPHTKIWPNHENPRGAGGAGRSRWVSTAAALGNLSRPGGPLAIFVSLLLHGVSGAGQWKPGVMSNEASWAGPTKPQPESLAKPGGFSHSHETPAGTASRHSSAVLSRSPLTAAEQADSQHLSQEGGGDLLPTAKSNKNVKLQQSESF